MLSGQVETSDGFFVTDGFVSVYSPEKLSSALCRLSNAEVWGGVLHSQFLNAFETDTDNIYNVCEPFALKKVATSLRGLCKDSQLSDPYNRQYIKFTGVNIAGETITADFFTRNIINAFDCVGKDAVGMILTNPKLYGGQAFMFVKPHPQSENNRYAIVLQTGGGK